MAEHKIALNWKKGDAPFTYETYPRNHEIIFKNGEDGDLFGRRPPIAATPPRAIRKTCWWRRCRPATC